MQIGLRQDKTALKSVDPGRFISPMIKTLKSKTVLSAQKVDNTEKEISDKITDISDPCFLKTWGHYQLFNFWFLKVK